MKVKIAGSLVSLIRKDPLSGIERVIELLNEISSLQDRNRLLEATALTDSLTGAYNERYFERAMEELDAQNHNSKRNPTGRHFLMMIDLDGFKNINDTYGHAAGNDTLCHVVKSISALIRKSDALCRVGGDEFILILKDSTVEGALAKIIEITDSFDTMSLHYRGIDIPVRASIGYGEIEPERFIKDILQEIDSNLYAAKEIKGASRFATLTPPLKQNGFLDSSPEILNLEQSSLY